MYSFGNGSGVGKGTTEPRQLTPWLIEPLDGEMIIDICTGDGHCLALTQRMEYYHYLTSNHIILLLYVYNEICQEFEKNQ